jgi:hypothetical protein
LISKGPGAIVFILFKSPPEFAGFGLGGAFTGSGASYLPLPYGLPLFGGGSLGVDGSRMVAPNGGNAESMPDDIMMGEGGPRGRGDVALRGGLPKGDLRVSFGVLGDALRESLYTLTGVN